MKELSNDERNALKKQVEAIKPALPRNWKKKLLEKIPSLNNNKGLVLINNVFHLRSVSEDITSVLISMAQEWASEINSITQQSISYEQ